VGWVSRHVVSAAVVVAAVAAMGSVLAFARPTYHPYVMSSPPGDGLSYTKVTYSAKDVTRAFAMSGIKLLGAPADAPRPAHPAPMVDFHDQDIVIEATVFGDRKTVDASGFSNYYTFVNGRWSLAPKTCVAGAKNAERWRGNVRVIVSCLRAGAASSTWLRRAALALGRL
jgi:hypothetical protein